MDEQDDFKMVDLIKYSNAYNLGWRYSRYENSKQMIAVIKKIAEYNKGDSFCEGLLNGFDAGRTKNPDKQKRMSELDIIFKEKGQKKDQDLSQER